MRLSLLAAVYKLSIVLHGSLQSLCKFFWWHAQDNNGGGLIDTRTWCLQLCGER